MSVCECVSVSVSLVFHSRYSSSVGSVLREQRETDQQCHPGALISRCGSAGAQL